MTQPTPADSGRNPPRQPGEPSNVPPAAPVSQTPVEE